MTKVYGWETITDPRKRPHVSVNLTDAEIAKLDFITRHTAFTKASFCREVIVPEIDKKVEKLKKMGF